MDSERAETYLRQLAEAELRGRRGDFIDPVSGEATRVRAVASAFTQIGALDEDRANSIIDDLTTALDLRPSVDQAELLTADDEGNLEPIPVSHAVARARISVISSGASSSQGAATRGTISVIPVGELLEVRDNRSDSDVYFLAVITTASRMSLCTAVHTVPPGSLPRRRRPNQGLRRHGPPPFAGVPGMPGVLRDLTAVDDADRDYHALFSGGGDETWSVGEFELHLVQRIPRRTASPTAAWLDVGTDENSVRIDLTARPPGAPVTRTPNSLSAAEQVLRARCEAVFTSDFHQTREGLPVLTDLVAALRAIGALPKESPLPGRIAALCDRYGSSLGDIADAPGLLPERWTAILAGRDRSTGRDEPESDDGHAEAARLSVTFPETDGMAVTLFGVMAAGHRASLHGVFFGGVRENDTGGPCIWLCDDTGQWHVAAQGNWTSHEFTVFAADIIPPIGPRVSSVDILLVSRTADLRARVPLTWWTS